MFTNLILNVEGMNAKWSNLSAKKKALFQFKKRGDKYGPPGKHRRITWS